MTNRKSEFSMLKGYSFVFEADGHLVEAWFSSLTGAEKIFVDGALVSKKRNIKRNSQTDFLIEGYSSVYSIDLTIISLLKGPFICTLVKDGVPIQRQRLVFPQLTFAEIFYRFLAGCLSGVAMFLALHVATTYLHWPSLLQMLIILLVCFMLFPKVAVKPVIEDELI
jgi:hypothetical protein